MSCPAELGTAGPLPKLTSFGIEPILVSFVGVRQGAGILKVFKQFSLEVDYGSNKK